VVKRVSGALDFFLAAMFSSGNFAVPEEVTQKMKPRPKLAGTPSMRFNQYD
jgi:hypothetical protein